MSMTYYTYSDTPVGPFLLAGDGASLTLASFTTGHQRREPAEDWVQDRAPLAEPIGQLEEYFSGSRTLFELELSLKGTEFQKQAWRALQAIPYGQTQTYGQIAHALGRPGAGRAVGSANAANVFPIFVPCHRVLSSTGGLAGFGGGLPAKRWLLEFEKANAVRHAKEKRTASSGGLASASVT